MAKLYFRHGAMNSGKSTALIQVAHNYEERGQRALLLKPSVDSKGGQTLISRIGVSRPVDILLALNDNVRDLINIEAAHRPVHCVLVDEAQFLSPIQIDDLFRVAVMDDIPVLAYGLRTDFQTVGFPGATRLLELAHSIEELKTICRCGRKATLNMRFVDGNPVFAGQQVAIDDNAHVTYESVCGTCYLAESNGHLRP